jgi:hypothetical protein
MSVEELEKANIELMNQKEEIRQEQLVLHAVLDRKNDEEAAMRRVEGMTPSEREALQTVLTNVGGIDSGEDVGGAQ